MTQAGKAADQDLRVPLDAFERIRNSSDTRMHDKSFDVAFEILVEGKKLSAVASAHGVSKQRALAIRDKVYSAYLLQAPEGWAYAQICAPKPMIERFVREADAERLKYWQQKAVTKGDP
ncbi:TrfB-related DNA-binding protein [Pseudomonas sp. Bout1]|uniref:TrfB-related DNA-binding protein n=1 Tax=Pseudomonas sp. Bout1 TaxID=3048600 RepID=UPI002AB3FDD2|nr:TrfB-related DNA-binding protein [Pseudomonas sp. Bout1]MDY7536441.1 TrfB-related DNA-binding protein [Pseudomonas sp. Bout1]MEB0187496.1 TrfB-related DNA-binding protein [Pseudomonas sp. Bout1]